MNQLLYKVATAAELLDVSRTTIYRMVKRGKSPDGKDQGGSK